jgi:hypothetical protein
MAATISGMLISVIVIGLMLFGAFGIWILTSTGREQKKAEANAPRLLDDAFDGSDTVTVTVNMSTMKYETVVVGAKERGYKLLSQADNQYGPHTLIFERA